MRIISTVIENILTVPNLSYERVMSICNKRNLLIGLINFTIFHYQDEHQFSMLLKSLPNIIQNFNSNFLTF